MACREFNFDSIVGPTHNYAGLAFGNLASQRHRNTASNPRQAALEGLAKMKLLADLGIGQAVLPPHERPDMQMLQAAGILQATMRRFSKPPSAMTRRSWPPAAALRRCGRPMRPLFLPRPDTADGRTALHRRPTWSASFTARLKRRQPPACFRAIFPKANTFSHHHAVARLRSAERRRRRQPYAALPLARRSGCRALRLRPAVTLKRPPAHGAFPRVNRSRPRKPSPDSINSSPGRRSLSGRIRPRSTPAYFTMMSSASATRMYLLVHEQAFADECTSDRRDRTRLSRNLTGSHYASSQSLADELSLTDAVETYLFNSQLVTPARQ